MAPVAEKPALSVLGLSPRKVVAGLLDMAVGLMNIFFLHGLGSTSGGLRPTYLQNHGHQVLIPRLPDDNFQASLPIAQAAFEQRPP